VALARALAAEPAVLVADEPTSLLDPSEQARFALVLREQQIESGLALVLVSHDHALVQRITDRVLVLDGGRLRDLIPSAGHPTGAGTPPGRAQARPPAAPPAPYRTEDNR
jgi:peptide/nickel transport system ATP-binding protein